MLINPYLIGRCMQRRRNICCCLSHCCFFLTVRLRYERFADLIVGPFIASDSCILELAEAGATRLRESLSSYVTSIGRRKEINQLLLVTV